MRTFSVIIPVCYEAATINDTISSIRNIHGGDAVEIIVVDGSPDAETVRAITDKDVMVKTSNKGRGTQMNAGAEAASGDVLLFLHVDTELPKSALVEIEEAMEKGRAAAGAFDLTIADSGRAFRIIEGLATLRSRISRVPYGDQGIFVDRDSFLRLGGYRAWPIMEDVDLMRRIKRTGWRICLIPDHVRTSSRRWRKEGIVRCTLRNWTIMILYLLGVAPEKLARWYP